MNGTRFARVLRNTNPATAARLADVPTFMNDFLETSSAGSAGVAASASRAAGVAAMGRFTFANGMTPAVERAFVERPHRCFEHVCT